MGLIDEIPPGPLGLDTAVFIYFIEEHPRYLEAVEPVFAAVDAGRNRAVTSALTLLEVLVVPLRAGDRPLAERYEEVLNRGRGLNLVAIDGGQLRAAAQLRAVHRGIRTPDALQLCAALSAGCSVFLTNDRRLPAVADLRIVQLRDYASG